MHKKSVNHLVNAFFVHDQNTYASGFASGLAGTVPFNDTRGRVMPYEPIDILPLRDFLSPLPMMVEFWYDVSLTTSKRACLFVPGKTRLGRIGRLVASINRGGGYIYG